MQKIHLISELDGMTAVDEATAESHKKLSRNTICVAKIHVQIYSCISIWLCLA